MDCLPAKLGAAAGACSGEPLEGQEGWTVYEGVRFLNDDPGGAPIELRAGTCVHVAMTSPEQLAVAAVQQVLKVNLLCLQGPASSVKVQGHRACMHGVHLPQHRHN